jgi:hypothetical protein
MLVDATGAPRDVSNGAADRPIYQCRLPNPCASKRWAFPLAGLYGYVIPYPIELLHKSNCDHVALVAALRAGDVQEAVEVSRRHVDVLHRTMFMGLTEGGLDR